MKTVIIGDIHGHDTWKQVVQQEQDADRFVFVGDYFDSFTVPGLIQCQNFQDIIEFKTTTSHKVILLIGNHDYHYFPEIGENGTSGYQARMAPTIQHIIDTNRDYLQMAYQFDDILVTHAGVSSIWADDVLGEWKVETLADQLNDLFKYQPVKVEYRSFKQVGDQVYGAYGFGDETFQGPLWIRPKSLMNANYDTLRKQIIQVVGHTGQKQIDIKGASTGGRYYFIDTMPREYLIINDRVVSLGKLENEKAQTK
jgi:UDP-2,3-diacylglucosamine pyrophosphatase LpxH